MKPFPRLVLASANEGKLREFRRLLTPLDIDVIPQAALGIPEADEPHATFVENALAKAPGVQSARYAGEPRSDRRNNDKLIADLAGIADRRAHYYCVLALMRHADDPEPILAEGRWDGTILDTPRGAAGFGYDPHFLDAESGLTGAELPLAQKNERSHRGKAMRALLARLETES